MGQSKADLEFGHETMLQRVIGRLSQSVDLIAVVAAADQQLPKLPPGTLVARDQLDYEGPLVGMGVGLAAVQPTGRQAAFVTSCDVPFLAPAFVDGLFGLLEGFDIVVPFEHRHFHPLSAVYRSGVVETVQGLVDQGERRPRALFDRFRTNRVDTESLRCFDSELRSLENLNTPAEYVAALSAEGLAVPDWAATAATDEDA